MLIIDNLHAAYGKVEVLHGISLEVPKGKLVTLIGSNGAGKTTTMRAISGMLKPRGGKVLLAGRDITGMDSHRIARAPACPRRSSGRNPAR
jgi:branched-chain amino acid transport system ATP-binding protein